MPPTKKGLERQISKVFSGPEDTRRGLRTPEQDFLKTQEGVAYYPVSPDSWTLPRMEELKRVTYDKIVRPYTHTTNR